MDIFSRYEEVAGQFDELSALIKQLPADFQSDDWPMLSNEELDCIKNACGFLVRSTGRSPESPLFSAYVHLNRILAKYRHF